MEQSDAKAEGQEADRKRELLIEERRAILSEVEAHRQVIRAKLAMAANLARRIGLTEKL